MTGVIQKRYRVNRIKPQFVILVCDAKGRMIQKPSGSFCIGPFKTQRAVEAKMDELGLTEPGYIKGGYGQ